MTMPEIREVPLQLPTRWFFRRDLMDALSASTVTLTLGGCRYMLLAAGRENDKCFNLLLSDTSGKRCRVCCRLHD